MNGLMCRMHAVVKTQHVLIEKVAVAMHHVEALGHSPRRRGEGAALEPGAPRPAGDPARRRAGVDDRLLVELFGEDIDVPAGLDEAVKQNR